ncbi:hypothetical protein DEO72_LG1g3293 [Vigna unguiculata]|uniref:Uncharacterized protein n=1 Tax=Vigna unguiculata TaxID=3917 RepID=A0A4D6KUR4_VIGUN|nr:hypothetical protein DEO72_LG1g3293 [Vigna unguiculata]
MEETLTVTTISAKGCLNRGTTFRSGLSESRNYISLGTLILSDSIINELSSANTTNQKQFIRSDMWNWHVLDAEEN